MVLSLETVADVSLLKRVWKREVRPVLRAMKFSTPNFAPDPIHYAAYEWGLEALVAALARDLKSGRYSPERGQIVRMAKTIGLSRPLCFLAPRDALVYRSITWLVSDQLVGQSPSWVGFAHDDKGDPKGAKAPEDPRESFDWFSFWLMRQGHIAKMLNDPAISYIVESDIANFFPSIRMEAIREHLHSQTNLEKEVVRLCVQIIDGVMPRSDYSEVSLLGLPQEQVGSSRAIAHSLLLQVDQEFVAEGSRGNYTRFMDDILVAVNTVREGEKCISRLQRSLETLGLYPNAAKTKITSVQQFLQDSMVDENGEIERFTESFKLCTSGTSPRVVDPPDWLISEILEFSNNHRACEDRPRRWGRVARRIYTLHRVAGIREWWKYWRDDFDADPGSAAAILEYVRSWPLTVDTVNELVSLSRDYGELYSDVSLFSAETLLSAPVGKDEALWNQIHQACRAEFLRLSGLPEQQEADRLAASWMLAAWKFGNLTQRQLLLTRISDRADAMSPVRAQALPLLAGLGKSVSEWVSAKPGLAWENALAAEYLRSLDSGEERAVGVALSLLEPQLRLSPQRSSMLPRAVPLLAILGRCATEKLSSAAPRFNKLLMKNPERLRDMRLETLVAEYCP
jgi:hypothetical protein